MNTQLIPGSLGTIAQSEGTSIAELFISADVIIVVDTSGSMGANDSRRGKSRYEIALEELAQLQRDLPGKIAVVAFSDQVEFCPGGVPIFFRGGTDLTKALQFVKVADGLVRFIVISDGQPDNEKTALSVASTFTSRIDVVYVGPESDLYSGRAFLEKLARCNQRGGKFATADRASELADTVEKLLLTA